MLKIFDKSKRKITTWSGGITEELYIYPEDSNYQKRDFSFRISIATTENENSIFTKLPKVNRILSILDGKMEIIHENHYKKILNKYEIDRFCGDWTTYSVGKVKDFNLMLKEREGNFFYYKVEGDKNLKFNDNSKFKFVFCINGEININNRIIKTDELIICDEDVVFISGVGNIFYGYIK